MKTIEARAIISAKDATGAVFSAISAKISKLNATAQAAGRRVNSAGARADTAERAGAARGAHAGRSGVLAAGAARSALGAAAGGIGLGGIGAGAAVYGGVKALRRYSETDMALTRIGVTADATDAEIGTLGKSMRDLAFGTGKSFDEVARGLDNLVAGGLDLDKALPAMPAIAKTAQAAGAEISDMANTALALNQGLGIATDKMQSSFDILVAGGKAGKFELKDMSRYMASIIPAATALGMKGEEGLKRIVAMLQTVRAGTGSTEEAASSVQNIFAKMESEETTNKFKKMGVDLRKEMKAARADGKELLSFFVELTEKTLKGDMSKLPQLFSDMEMSRGMRAILKYKDVQEKVMADLNKSAGAANADFDRIMARPKVAIDRLSESWDRLKDSAGAAIDALGGSKGLQNVAKIFEDTANYYNKPAEERARLDLEKRRREKIEPQIAELQQKIEIEERAAREKPGFFDGIIGRPGKTTEERLQSPLLQTLRKKLFELQQQLAAKQEVDPPSSIFSDKEIEQREEVDRERRRGEALSSMKPPGRAKKPGIPLPSSDPRKAPNVGSAGENNIHDLPPYQAGGSDDHAQSVTVTGEVTGQTTVEVKFGPTSELVQVVSEAKAVTAQMKGMLRQGNGPGSTGRSSPDSAAPRGGASGVW